jgi:rhodanese-related sulfurtransferase
MEKNSRLEAKTSVWFLHHDAWTKLQRHIGTKKKRDKVTKVQRHKAEKSVRSVPLSLKLSASADSSGLPREFSQKRRDREILVICRSGQRAYIATRVLLQNGFEAKNVSGGMLSLAHNYLFGTDNR